MVLLCHFINLAFFRVLAGDDTSGNIFWSSISQCTDWSLSNSNKIFHYCIITIFQAKNSKTRKQNVEKYIAPFPWLIIVDIPNPFVKISIGMNTDEFCRWYIGLKKFLHLQVSVRPHEISSHFSLISAKKYQCFYCETLEIWI